MQSAGCRDKGWQVIELRPEDRFEVSPSVRTRALDDELVLLDLRGGEYFSLNATGAEVWHALERGLDLGEIEQDVAVRWPVTSEERRALIRAVVEELVNRGLVQRCE